METPRQTCARLLTALEDLVVQEAVLVRAEDFPALVRTERQAAPLVERLVALAGSADEAGRARVRALLVRRTEAQAVLSVAIKTIGEALRQTQDSQRRVSQIGPVYGQRPAKPARQLSVKG